MEKSESIAALAGALAVAQGQINGARKDTENPFFKSKYADLASVVGAIKKPLAENGLSYIQIIHDEVDGARVETVILHKTGEWISTGCISVPVAKKDAQSLGSALTYARRYSLSAAFGVAPEDDDGNAAVQHSHERQETSNQKYSTPTNKPAETIGLTPQQKLLKLLEEYTGGSEELMAELLYKFSLYEVGSPGAADFKTGALRLADIRKTSDAPKFLKWVESTRSKLNEATKEKEGE